MFMIIKVQYDKTVRAPCPRSADRRRYLVCTTPQDLAII
jgi:hypothetical protein